MGRIEAVKAAHFSTLEPSTWEGAGSLRLGAASALVLVRKLVHLGLEDSEEWWSSRDEQSDAGLLNYVVQTARPASEDCLFEVVSRREGSLQCS